MEKNFHIKGRKETMKAIWDFHVPLYLQQAFEKGFRRIFEACMALIPWKLMVHVWWVVLME